MKPIKLYSGVLILACMTLLLFIGCNGSGNDARAQKAPQGEHDDHGHDEPDAPEAHETAHDEDEDEDEDEDAHADEHVVVHLSDAQLIEFDITLAEAKPGQIATFVDLPGEIVINDDQLAHIVPRVAGTVRKVHKKLGDPVVAGEILAEIESRELAELKVAYLSARERHSLAREFFEREKALWQKKISAEQDFLSARQALSEARIALQSARETLRALGFSEKALAKQATEQDTLTRYLLTAPFGGTIIQRHLTLGETVKDDAQVFMVADLSSVWVDIQVYSKDLPIVAKGQSVTVDAGHQLTTGQGTIAYVGPIIGETTRTAPARVVLDNRDGRWRPGTFVTARIATGNHEVPLLIPRSALQTIDDRQVVFVRKAEGFEPETVTLGRSDAEHVEILTGIALGQTYVSKGAFTLKAQLSKNSFGDGHNH
ncbi:MAG: hypothetical protein VR64_04320 [Desulfatitalea sp. BRH_c12]|nr:MAG: hypothetical protein VR64_04320 [Desulfatitalea sp. BRH_c12]